MVENNRWRLIEGDVIKALKDLESNSFDACLTDPPYGFKGFLDLSSRLVTEQQKTRHRDRVKGMNWANAIPSVEAWREVYRVLKPGAYLLSFAGTRTWHHFALNLEHAGFTIKDTLMWLYSSGFPKNLNISIPTWNGYGTALKPAWEPILMCQKPLDGTYEHNISQWECGALNINGTKLPSKRWPANLMADDVSSKIIATQRSTQHDTLTKTRSTTLLNFTSDSHFEPPQPEEVARFFYCAKASPKERSAGIKNPHPTVKPLDLCRYLSCLIRPPPRSTPRKLLVPFSGSGSEMLGGLQAGWDHVTGIELNPIYIKIANQRLQDYERQLHLNHLPLQRSRIAIQDTSTISSSVLHSCQGGRGEAR